MTPLLQYLIHDPTYGYLFAHRLAMVAFGLRSDSQLRKYYPQLTLNTDYLKLRGEDHVDRIFYTLSGLQKLVSYLQTPQASQFWAELTQYIQAQQKGAMVPQPQSPLVPQVPVAPGVLNYELPVLAQDPFLDEPSETYTSDSVVGPSHLVARTPVPDDSLPVEREQALAQLAAYLEPAIERAIASQWLTTPPVPSSLSLDPLQLQKQTADIIFQGQRLASEAFQKGAETATSSQGYLLNFPNLFQEADDWLARQDRFAVALISVSVVALCSVAGYFVMGVFSPSPQPSLPQPQPGYVQPQG